MTKLQKFFGHWRTVRRHRREVRKLCFKCGLYWQGLTHDLSKYSPTEFWNGVKYFTGTDSPHNGERKAYGYSKAWLHHKAHNKHHAEYWQDVCRDDKTVCANIPIKYFVEMVCDRIAACKVYRGDKFCKWDPFNYYLTHLNENQFSPKTRALLRVALIRYSTLSDTMFITWLRELLEDDKRAYDFLC